MFFKAFDLRCGQRISRAAANVSGFNHGIFIGFEFTSRRNRALGNRSGNFTDSRNGDQLSLDDWKNAVAFEVREADADGTLICVTDAQRTEGSVTFSVKGGWKDTYKVYAVVYDNSRTEVDFE